MCQCLKREISLEFARQNGFDLDNMARFNDDYSMFENQKKIKLIYDKMKKFIDEIDTTVFDTVLLFGNTGVGKTYLMECMMSYAIEKCKQVKFVTAFNFNQDMLKYHCANLEEKSVIMEDYLEADILFIDDLGTENKINNVTCEYLYSVINDRLIKHKKTVISTNLDFGQIQKVYGERIFSRLMHKKNGLRVNFEGSDLRLKK
jgi:DNA replication protein DnaC